MITNYTQRALCITGAAFVTLNLAACGQQRPVIVLPPVALTECADEPLAPAIPGKDQQAERDRLVLDYILSLRSAWGDCKARVDSLRVWREKMGK